jgi:hypothetical protein
VSLFGSSIRPPAPVSDEAIERYLAAIRAQLDPDPLFRRRLRGHVVNRFVAAREGLATRWGPAREMSRIGRAVLYASFALSAGVTGAMAASEQAVPGDVLYPLKLQIEDLRERVVPDRLQDELAAYALAQRIDELDRLAAAGNWAAVAHQVEAVEAAYLAVLSLSPDAASLEEDLAVATRLLEQLPDRALAAVERAMGDVPGLGSKANGGGPASPGSGGGRGRPEDAAAGSGGAPGGQAPVGPSKEPGSEPSRGPSERADATPRPQPQAMRTPRPSRTPAPTPVPTAEPTPAAGTESAPDD